MLPFYKKNEHESYSYNLFSISLKTVKQDVWILNTQKNKIKYL